MHYSKIREYDVANGPGVRTTLFVSGCTHGCEGCFNSALKEFNSGSLWTSKEEDNFVEYSKRRNIVGINILGGEPLQQDFNLKNLLIRLKEEVRKPIWLWTGYTWEEIIKDENKLEIVKLVDVLIDGRFELSKRNLMLQYKGSENQRVINVEESLKENTVILRSNVVCK